MPKKDSAITLSDDAARTAIGSLKRYFSEELDEELSDLRASLLLEFIVKRDRSVDLQRRELGCASIHARSDG